jgi:diaminohydroxyphosphoribosylaminopyrimidine deaminase/5-amino-6-(5-phosphoribosylamino)uracil reductase
MQRALQLAKLGGVGVAPNPMVGAVVVLNGKIIGEGYHKKYGEAHAEVNAIQSVADPSLLNEATMYVTLEPCAHFGKTPPCADLLVKHQFKRVVIACVDTFSEVAGKGIERLKNNGIEVELGVLEEEARSLNKRFFCYHEKRRPYIILKWAQTTDGFIDRLPSEREAGVNWITQPETKLFTHQWRAQEQAILVGWKTIENDNPSLTVREVSGNSPYRYVIDPRCQSNPKSVVYSDGSPTTVFVEKNTFVGLSSDVEVIEFNAQLRVIELLTTIWYKKHLSVFIEGGKNTLEQFIEANLWDEARVLEGELNFVKGITAPVITHDLLTKETLGKDHLYTYLNK